MENDAEQVSLKAIKDATRRLRGHLVSVSVWLDQLQLTLHSMRHEMTKLTIAIGLQEMAENDKANTDAT